MLGTYRAVLLWLIAIAIPMQGISAVVMPLCAPAVAVVSPTTGLDQAATGAETQAEASHGQLAMPGSPATANMRGHDHEHEHAHGHEHAQGQLMADQSVTHPSVPGLENSGHSGHSGHSMLNCCSAACSMAVYFWASAAKHSPMPSLAPEQADATFYPDIFLDGLERPPRSFLA